MKGSRTTIALTLVFLLFAPMLAAIQSSQLAEETVAVSPSTGNLGQAPDVPNYRIGDEWVYDTQFDVAQLLAQANVSASLNTLTGETTNKVTDIMFETDETGQQVLVYEITIEGAFSSGNSGATLEGTTGRLNIDYDGVDILRARDLAVMTSNFNLDVKFAPFNLGFLEITLGDVTFDNTYTPAKERHDFPLRTGDQWYMPFEMDTQVTGTSDYFDPSEFDDTSDENNSWQIIKNEAPSEDGDVPDYTGCDDSYKIVEWNETGVSAGFNWYCPAVRGDAWTRISNSAGFTIDWILKEYDPADSNSVDTQSSPGGRNTNIHVGTTFSATLPNANENISIEYVVAGSPPNPVTNTNLQLRYEINGTIANPTTDSVDGKAGLWLDVSNQTDTTPSSDDHTSNGVVAWDPMAKIIGATTIVQDLSVVGVDLLAQSGSIIVERTRDGQTSTLGASIGFNALPGDVLSFSLPAQNRGVLPAPATTMEIETPDGTIITKPLPSLQPYGVERIDVDWSVPENMTIGMQSMRFTVDPDMNVTADANRTNNEATIAIFIGRAPVGSINVSTGKYTFENITLDASASFDEDGGDVGCRFEIESRLALIDVIEAPDCLTHWNWTNSGMWSVKVIVTDDELDVDELEIEVEVLNRAPSFNLTHPESVVVEQQVTIEAVDIVDIDTSSPTGQQVSISWPGLDCSEGLTQPTCTFIPSYEGEFNITAIATDDDGATTTVLSNLSVLNVPPTVGFPELWTGGEQQYPDLNGSWHLNEDEVALLRAVGNDTGNDLPTLLIEWYPSMDDEDWTITSVGSSSSEAVSWGTDGPHLIRVRAIDTDGASSEFREANIMIHNVAPSITGLPGNTPIFEDDPLNLSVTVSDTASDIDSLEVCWDFDATVDVDNDGDMQNDCEMNGTSIERSWITSGVRWITATVTDDNGATATQSMNVSVLNIPPTSIITPLRTKGIEGLMEGQNLTLTGENSSDTAGDKSELIFQWDSSHLDMDLDGSKTGDVDFVGSTWTIENLPVGTWTVTLTVTDDDGEFSQEEITFVVKAAPAEGLFESVSQSFGTTTTLAIMVLGIVIAGLLVFLFLTRPGSDDSLESLSVFEQGPMGMPSNSPTPYEAPPTSLAPSAPAPVEQPPMAPAEQANSGPPLPATGLPQGWTMEQWNYYGEQWLVTNQPVQAVQQPIVSQTQPTSAPSELQSLLDDLDF